MDALAVVKHLNSLAQKVENRETIVKDQGCLPGLVLFLDNTDSEVVLLVLKTLQLLAEHAPNRKVMLNEVGMIESLKSLMQGNRFIDIPDIKRRATSLHNQLHLPTVRKSKQARVHTVAPTSQKFFVGSSNKKAKLIVLQITGLHDESTKKMCEEALLQVRGVVSFTFNMTKHRCMVRVVQTVSGEMLCKAVEKTKILTAEQVIRNQSGEEVVLSFGRHPSIPGEEKRQTETDYPDYLPEEDPVETSKTAISKHGEKDNGGGGWFSGVSSFISSSLYW
ncbi:armadillo repeat-containing protein 1-like isoform X1 [Hydractinia symbiolongicarpus]|uniref:armadillo repeat-containing protein 1-like isoform X1 n=1 Tax=Hydractinia symbiolongicarpus TaxID=13093 RepID=UPI00254B0AC5|nr:armadillo repeat-containing protein 1-like isoform X1 [Hydractinia symbiolongicarpus]